MTMLLWHRLGELDVYYIDAQTGRPGQTPISGYDTGLVVNSGSDIEGIIGADVVPVLPSDFDQRKKGQTANGPSIQVS
jgi:hypothetical protein